MNLNVWRTETRPYPRMMSGGGLEISYLLSSQARSYVPRMIGQQVTKQKSTRFAQQNTELAVGARFLVPSPKEWVFFGFEWKSPRRDSLFGPNSQSIIGDSPADDAFHLGEVVPILAVFVGIAGRRQFLHFITEGSEGITADTLRALASLCKRESVCVRWCL